MGSLLNAFGSMTVIEGVCPYGGADKLIGEWAYQNYRRGVKHVPMPAKWTTLGKAAGPERNSRMLQRLLREDGHRMVVAFHGRITESRGTKDMVEKALQAGVETWLFDGWKLTKGAK